MYRRANFFATANADELLTDVTGNVRWLIFNIESVNHDEGGKNGYQSVNINDVWAQAYTLYKQGERYQMTKDEKAYSENKNANHMVTTVEMELIKENCETSKEHFLTTTLILNSLQLKTTAKINVTNIGKALKFLRYKKERRYNAEKKFTEVGYAILIR